MLDSFPNGPLGDPDYHAVAVNTFTRNIEYFASKGMSEAEIRDAFTHAISEITSLPHSIIRQSK